MSVASAIAAFRVLSRVTMQLHIGTYETTHRVCISGGACSGAGTPHKGAEQWHRQILSLQLCHPGEKSASVLIFPKQVPSRSFSGLSQVKHPS